MPPRRALMRALRAHGLTARRLTAARRGLVAGHRNLRAAQRSHLMARNRLRAGLVGRRGVMRRGVAGRRFR